MLEAPAHAWAALGDPVPPGVVALVPAELHPGLGSVPLAAGWRVGDPRPGVPAPTVVVLAPGGASDFEVRRAATLARAEWPAALVVLRGEGGGTRAWVDAVVGEPVVVTGSWHGLLAVWPGPGEIVMLRADAADLPTVLGRLAELRRTAPAPWVRLRSDADGVELLARDGARLVARRGRESLDVLRDELAVGQTEEVVAGAWPTPEELLARYQASVARRERVVPRLRAHGDHVAVFRAPGWSSPVTLVSRVTLDDDGGRRRLAHHDLRLNGLKLGRVPRLPLMTGAAEGPAPLGLAIDEAYAYRVAGPDDVDGVPCWRLDFAPRAGADLPSGRAFLERATGELVRLETVSGARRGPFASSRQVEHLEVVAVAGTRARLVTRVEVDELYDAAGHHTPVRRVLRLGAYEVPASALSGDVVVELPRTATLAREPRGIAASDPIRARVRTVAAGVLFDPGIGDPLPFVGGSWSELDLFGTGTQAQVVLGGAVLRAAWTQPRLLSPSWELRFDAAAALVSWNDRAFRGGREVYEENVRQRPMRAALLVGRRAGAARLRAGYELAHTRLERGDDTAADFVVPASPLVHALRAEADVGHGPWSLRATLLAARRSEWPAWGRPTVPEVSRRSFQRFGATVSRVAVARPRVQARVEIDVAAGRHLDRFSRFGFDALENRLQGYPTAALRHDGAVVGRLAGSATLHPRLRLSAFADAARVWGSSGRDATSTHAGAGGSLETTLGGVVVSGEWAHGFRAPLPGGGTGADVVRLTAFVAF